MKLAKKARTIKPALGKANATRCLKPQPSY
jgi:hypothetical protein